MASLREQVVSQVFAALQAIPGAATTTRYFMRGASLAETPTLVLNPVSERKDREGMLYACRLTVRVAILWSAEQGETTPTDEELDALIVAVETALLENSAANTGPIWGGIVDEVDLDGIEWFEPTEEAPFWGVTVLASMVYHHAAGDPESRS